MRRIPLRSSPHLGPLAWARRQWRRVDGSDARSLVAKKSKQLVLSDGSTKRAAKLISFQQIVGGAEEVASVQVAIAYELEKVTVPCIRAGLGDDVDHRPGMQPIARRQAVGLNAEFLKCIGKRKGQVDVR